MKRNLFYLLLSCSILFFGSCEKSDDADPIAGSGSKDHFMPLSVGNSWTYDSDYYGEYTVSVTGEKEINGKDYLIVTNSLNPGAESYMRYDGNKLYSYSTAGSTSIELLIVDEDATQGQEWVAGNIELSQPGIYTYSVKYTCKFVKFHETYTFNGKNYSNVMEMNLKTAIADFEFGSYYTSLFDAEELASLKAEFESSLQNTAINQTQFYAKGIGYVNQVSSTMPQLNVELKDYTIK